MTSFTPARAGALLAVIMVALAGASCAVTKVGSGTPEVATYELTGDRIVIDSDFGELEVVPVAPAAGPNRTVTVTRWFEAEKTAGTARADWSKVGDDTIKLGGVCSGVVIDCNLRHRVEVPSNIPVKITADTGSVVANGFTAALDIKVTDGNLNLDQVSGPVVLATRDGSLRAERLTSDRVSAKSDNGYAILEFDEPPATVETRSADGNTTIRVPDAGYKIKTDLRDAKSTIKVAKRSDADRKITAAVSNGRLRIEAR